MSIRRDLVTIRNAKRFRPAGANRTAAAVVELAVTLPVLLLVTFGTLEVCNRLFLRQTAAVAAYEGARLAARRTITQDQVQTRCMSLLLGRRIVNGQVVITPSGSGLTSLATGGQLTVRVTIPIAGNTPVSYVFAPTGSITATAVMLRE
jgi:Flp pilus assembly protein TadG